MIEVCAGDHVWRCSPDKQIIKEKLKEAHYPYKRCETGLNETLERLESARGQCRYYKVIGNHVLQLELEGLKAAVVEFMQPRCTVAPSAFAQLSHNPKYSTALATRFNCVVATQPLKKDQPLWDETLRIIRHSKTPNLDWETLDEAYKALGYPEWFMDTTADGQKIGVNLMPQSAAMGIFNLNSSKSPNVHIKLITTNTKEKVACLRVYALKAISAGEELCWSYEYNTDNPSVEAEVIFEANKVVFGFAKSFEYKIEFPTVTALQQRTLYKWCASPAACEKFDNSVVPKTCTIEQPDSSPVHWCCSYNFACRPDDLTLAMLRWSDCETSLDPKTLDSFCDTDDTSYVSTYGFATAPELHGILVEYATSKMHTLIDQPFKCYNVATETTTMKSIHELQTLLGDETCLVDGKKTLVAELATTIQESQKRVLLTATHPTKHMHIQIDKDTIVSAIVAFTPGGEPPNRAHILTAFPVDFWAWLRVQGKCTVVANQPPKLRWGTGATLQWNKTGWNCSVQDANKLFEWQLGVLHDGEQFKAAIENGDNVEKALDTLFAETQALQLNRRYVAASDDVIVISDSESDDGGVILIESESDNDDESSLLEINKSACLAYLEQCSNLFKLSKFTDDSEGATIFYFASVLGQPYVCMMDDPTDAPAIVVQFESGDRFTLASKHPTNLIRGAVQMFGTPWPPPQLDVSKIYADQTQYVDVSYNPDAGHYLVAKKEIPQNKTVAFYYGRAFLNKPDAIRAEQRKPWFTADSGMTVDSHFFRLGKTETASLVAGIRGFEYGWLRAQFADQKIGLMSLSNSAESGTNTTDAPLERSNFPKGQGELSQLYGGNPLLKTTQRVSKDVPLTWNYTKSWKHNEKRAMKRPSMLIYNIMTFQYRRSLLQISTSNKKFKGGWLQAAKKNIGKFCGVFADQTNLANYQLFDPAHDGDCGTIIMAAAFKKRIDAVKEKYTAIKPGYVLPKKEFVHVEMLVLYCASNNFNCFALDVDNKRVIYHCAPENGLATKTFVILVFDSNDPGNTHFAALRRGDIIAGDELVLCMDAEELQTFFQEIKVNYQYDKEPIPLTPDFAEFTVEEGDLPAPKKLRPKRPTSYDDSSIKKPRHGPAANAFTDFVVAR